MTICWPMFVIFSLTSSIVAEAVNICSVQPTAKVVVVGETVSLNCTATGVFNILSWEIGTDINNKTVVYTAPSYGPNGTIREKEYLADGYSVINVAENKISLNITQTRLSQAGSYVCKCDDQLRSQATTAVVVLASEPTFSVISSVTNGKPISFSCNISFNGSADISSNLTIKDNSGSTVNRTDCSAKNGLTSCNLKYTITANASIDQSYSCAVHLITSNNILYSRFVNCSLEWQRVSNAEIVVSNPRKCSAEKCDIHENIKCKTDGNPGITFFKWWKILNNGDELQVIGDGNQNLELNKIGQFTYQCEAYNFIRGAANSATSETFTINVTDNDDYPVLALPIGIAVVACVIIAILTAAIIVLYRKLQKKGASDAVKVSTEDSSAHYAALDAQTSSGERKRETYTAIQLPIQSQQVLRGDYMNTNLNSEYETVN